MNELNQDDEFLHKPTERTDWRESYYFNWVDAERGVSGFSTIGLLPNARKREFVFALFYDDKRVVHYHEPEGSVPLEMDLALSDNVLSYRMNNPFGDWIIDFKGPELQGQITWSGRFQPYDFGMGSGTSWEGHFEQSGHVTGNIHLNDGRSIYLDCFGQRDKSWGSRDWHIERWYAFHAQFDDFSVGLRHDVVEGRGHASGGISTKEGNVSIKDVEFTTEFIDKPIHMPVGSRTKITVITGEEYIFLSHLLSQNAFVRFEREFKHGCTELFEEMALHTLESTGNKGTGLLEWLFTKPKA